MYRPSFAALAHHRHPSRAGQEIWARFIFPFTICLFVVISLRYGYYGDYRMLLGPCSSRLFKANSVFVKQVEVRDNGRKGLILYEFSRKPDLNLEENWSVTNYVIIKSYSRKGFSLWLNKGSRIQIGWQAETSILNKLQVSVIKGEKEYKQLPPTNSSGLDTFSTSAEGREAEYLIEEDDTYHTGIINLSPISTMVKFKLNVSSKVHDLSKAKSMCSPKIGSCRLNLLFPNTQYLVVTTPNNGDLGKWYVEISFLARLLAYLAILGAIVLTILLLVKCLGSCNDEETQEAEQARTSGRSSESEPLVQEKVIGLPYGTDEDQGYNTGASSEDLYDGKICVICYDMTRNCFFVPCGHCATCHDCAMRIMEEEGKICPICRRLIHKVKKLILA